MDRQARSAPWIAIGIIAVWALGLAALLVELARAEREDATRRAGRETARYDGL
jgi:hypothetical protein